MKVPKINFVFDRRKTARHDKKGSIELRVTYESRQKFLATGILIYPSQWDKRNELVTRSLDSVELNTILAGMRQKALKVISKMAETGKFDIQAIPLLLKNKSVDMTFTDYVYKRIKKKKVSENTHKTYITMYNKLVEYGKMTFFSDITQKNIRDFSEWLHNYTWEEKDKYGKIVKR